MTDVSPVRHRSIPVRTGVLTRGEGTHEVDDDAQERFCSFCGEQGSPRPRLAGGLGAMICVPCVDSVHAAVHPVATPPDRATPPWESLSQDEMLATLPVIMRNADQVTAFATDWVGLLRERGASWSAIGRALGVTRQAAWDRFSKRIATGTAS